jgi:hypothetical protein
VLHLVTVHCTDSNSRSPPLTQLVIFSTVNLNSSGPRSYSIPWRVLIFPAPLSLLSPPPSPSLPPILVVTTPSSLQPITVICICRCGLRPPARNCSRHPLLRPEWRARPFRSSPNLCTRICQEGQGHNANAKVVLRKRRNRVQESTKVSQARGRNHLCWGRVLGSRSFRHLFYIVLTTGNPINALLFVTHQPC